MTVSNNVNEREEHEQKALNFLAAHNKHSADELLEALEKASEEKPDNEDYIFLHGDMLMARTYGSTEEYLEAAEEAAKVFVP